MKRNLFLVLAIVLGCTFHSSAQKLEENKTDDLNKNSVKRTSWETLYSSGSVNAHFRFSLIDSHETFDLKLMRGEVFAIEKDMEVVFKLDNNDVVKLQNLEYAITCKGCGAVGFNGSATEGLQTVYPISKEDVEKLKAHKVVKITIYTSDGYLDNDIKDKNSAKITASLNIL